MALNEVKSLNYITCELQLPHNNLTNFANEIDANLLNNSSNKQRVVNVDVEMDVDTAGILGENNEQKFGIIA